MHINEAEQADGKLQEEEAAVSSEDTVKDEAKKEKKQRIKKDKTKKEKTAEPPRFKVSPWHSLMFAVMVYCFTGVYVELALHICVFGSINGEIIYPILFALMFGVIMTFIGIMVPRIVNDILISVVTVAEVVYAEVQMVYHAIFGSFMALNQVSMGEGVVTNFGKQIMFGISQNIPKILVLLVPIPVVILLVVKFRRRHPPIGWKQRVALPIALCALIAMAAYGLHISKTENFSVYKVLTNVNSSTDISYKKIGMLATTEQEIRYMLTEDGDTVNPLSEETIGITTAGREYNSKMYNVMDLDFDKLKESTDDETLQSLDDYFNTVIPTRKNDYTGMLEGYNLITICAESYCPYFVSEELTPALYKLSNNGILFKNYYGTYQSVTTNGEYTMCMGLYPDLSRTKTQSSFDVAATNYLPFCLGNILGSEGYQTWAYHDYIGEFYNRNISHPNMGYTFQAADSGLDITVDWPSSDLEMMEASVDDYLDSDQPFHAYYMTFSGHYQYNWDNAMSKKNQSAVEDMDYSDTVKAYIACNLELEYAMEYLLERLEEAGVADKTVIVLTNDHYPYGLTEEEYNELAGETLDTTYEKYRNSFICYVPGLEENIEVDDYCSTADILPTLLNLFGVEYDSRLLAGTDIFSDGIHMAVLQNQSFLTEDFRYDAETETVTVNEGGEEPSEELLDRYITYVSNKFAISTNILNSNYYAHAFQVDESDSSMEDTVVFTDIKNIFNQASAVYMYRHGYVTPENEEEGTFGGTKIATVGEFLDVMYRIAGCPETDTSYLPEDYADDKFLEECQWQDAVCWAYQVGIIRDGDDVTKWNRSMNYRTAARFITRFAELNGISTEVDATELQALIDENPRIDEQELREELWVNDANITTKDSDLEELINNRNSRLDRYQMTSFLFYFCTYELDIE